MTGVQTCALPIYNAVTEYADHVIVNSEKAMSLDRRLVSSWFGTGEIGRASCRERV